MSSPRLISEGIPNLLPMQNRSPGVHVSSIIHALCVELGHYPDRGGEITPQVMTLMQLGQAFEDMLIRRMEKDDPKRYLRLGEIECDGVYLTPDLMDVIDWAVHEIKLTWKSSRNLDIEGIKFKRYWWQLKAYCWAMETCIGRLHVGFIRGNYSEDKIVDYKVWEWEWTKEELEANWKMLIGNIDKAKAEE